LPHTPKGNSIIEVIDGGESSDTSISSRCSTPSRSTEVDSPSTLVNKSTPIPKHGHWVQDFEIPWYKMPQSLLQACKQKVRPKPSDRREMVRIVCDDIRKHSTLPGRKNLSKIASTIVAKHKESFCDVVGDKVIGSGYESLRKQMEERLFNLNREGKKTSSFGEKLNEVDGTSEPPAKKTRKPVKDSYGCVNWQPDSYPENENKETQKEKQEWLISEYAKADQDKQDQVKHFMKLTYTSQRRFINKQKPMPPTVDEIKELWPFLFFKDYLLQHFQELMGFELHVVFMETVERKAKVIFDYMKQELSRKRVKDSVKLIEDAMEFREPKAVKMTGVCFLLLAYFDEEEEKMIRCFDVSNIIFNFNLAD
jgi:hypothetical protein